MLFVKQKRGFLVGVVPLEGHLHGDVLLGVLDVDRGLVEHDLVAVQVLHEGIDAAGVEEVVAVPLRSSVMRMCTPLLR